MSGLPGLAAALGPRHLCSCTSCTTRHCLALQAPYPRIPVSLPACAFTSAPPLAALCTSSTPILPSPLLCTLPPAPACRQLLGVAKEAALQAIEELDVSLVCIP